MQRDGRVATIVGVLLIVSTVAGILSVAPSVDSPDYLFEAPANAGQVLWGALFQFVMAVAYAGVAITLYPLLRKYNESLALGFFSFRIIASVFLIIGMVCLLLLLAVSQKFVRAGVADSSHFRVLADLLRTGRDFVNHVAMILPLGAGSLMLYSLLYRAKLIPVWLTGWGVAGTVMTMAASLLVMFRLVEVISTPYIVLNLPLAAQEMVFAVWLIVKGFNQPAVDLASSKKGS